MGVATLKQETKISSSHPFSAVNIALSENWYTIALSNGDGRRYSFEFHGRQDLTLSQIITKTRENNGPLKVRIGLVSSGYTLIPNDLYFPSKDDEYLYQNLAVESSPISGVDTIYSHNLRNVYHVENDVFAGIDNLEEYKIYHYISPLLTFLPRKDDRVFVVWLYDRALIMGCKDGAIQMAKMVAIEEREELMYQTLLAYKLCELDRSVAHLTLLGRFNLESPIYKMFYKYFQHLDLPMVPHTEKTEAHWFYDMYLMSKYL